MSADVTQKRPVGGNAGPDQTPAQDQILYDVPNAARVLDLSDRQVWNLVKTGAIKSFKLGNSRRIHREALVEFVDNERGAAG